MKTDWFKDWFESDEYLKVYSHRNLEDAKKLTATLFKKIDLPDNALVLDAACGNGRYSLLLSESGFRVVGFDLSKNLLLRAKENTSNNRENIFLFRADIRHLCFKVRFDLILLAFTSFGYFETDEENFKFTSAAFDFLKPGGYFVLDFFNPAYLEKHLVPYSEKNVSGLEIRERRKIENGKVIKTIEISGNGEVKKYEERVKLYSQNFIVNRMETIGYKIVDIFGNYEGNKFDGEKSERLIIIAQK